MRLSSRKKKERRISIRTSDDTVIAWVNNQDSITKSVSLALKAWVRTHGTGDVIDKIVDDYMRYTSLKPMSIDDVAEPVDEVESVTADETKLEQQEQAEQVEQQKSSEQPKQVKKPEQEQTDDGQAEFNSSQEETDGFDIGDLMMQEYNKKKH